MTIRLSAEGPASGEIISEAEELLQDFAAEVSAAIRKIKAGEWDGKATGLVVKDMRAALQLVLEERNKVAKFNKQEAGVVYDYALDFDAARIEIGRRLARLRDAGDG